MKTIQTKRRQYIVPFTESIEIIDAEELLKPAPQTYVSVDDDGDNTEFIDKDDSGSNNNAWGDIGDID